MGNPMIDPGRMQAFLFAIAVGLIAGTVFFGGLWWTVRRLPTARRPLVLYFGSLAVRAAVVALAFFALLSLHDWPQLIAALGAFLVARLALTWRLGPSASSEDPAQKAS